MFSRKYKLIPAEPAIPPALAVSMHEEKEVPMFRLKALRDIPEHGVKKGDLGGRVTNKQNLSQDGSCWISYDAQVFGKVYIQQDAYISDSARVLCLFEDSYVAVKDNVKIYGNAVVFAFAKYYGYREWPVETIISGDAQIYGDTWIRSAKWIGQHAKIHGEAFLDFPASVSGNAEICGEVEVGKECIVTGNSTISGNVFLDESVFVDDSIIDGYGTIPINSTIISENMTVTVPSFTSAQALEASLSDGIAEPPSNSAVSTKSARALQLLDEVMEELAGYETDIVKIIQYPSMTDRSVPETRDMIVALKLAKRLSNEPESDDFIEAVADLEKKFLTAESVALKISSTAFTPEEKKKTEKAKDLLAMASNEASSDNEKELAFKQAFKQLEGIVIVPEIAVDTFRAKIGLKELMSL